MLATPRAPVNGPAFLVGWIAGLAVVGVVVLSASGGADATDSGGPADWVSVLKLALGVVLLLVALREWRGRPVPGAEPEMPKWMHAVDGFTARRAAALGALLSAVNPKNLLLAVGAATAIAQTGAPSGEQAVALAVFILVATLGPGIPVVVYFAMGSRSAEVLDHLKRWMSHNNAAIMATICLIIGAKLIGDGIAGLSA
jgi:threonine/homoserine/homoserine lactone efflux protein